MVVKKRATLAVAEEILVKEVVLMIALEILVKEEAVFVVAEEILIAEAELVARREILVVEEMEEHKIGNKICEHVTTAGRLDTRETSILNCTARPFKLVSSCGLCTEGRFPHIPEVYLY